MIGKTGNSQHDSTVVAAEAVRQNLITPGASAATVRTAEISYYRSLEASRIANNLPGSEFRHALWILGTGGN
jgi:hypothetical protein